MHLWLYSFWAVALAATGTTAQALSTVPNPSPPPPALPVTVCNDDKSLCATSVPQEKRTSVRKMPTDEELWAVNRYLPSFHLSSNGGMIFVLVPQPIQAGASDAFIYFYSRSGVQSTATFGQIYPNLLDAPQGKHSLRWGEIEANDNGNQLVLRLVNGRRVTFQLNADIPEPAP